MWPGAVLSCSQVMQMEFDLDDFLDAFRGQDLERWAGWYAENTEWTEYRNHDHVVPGKTSAAFMVTVTLPDRRRIIENVIIEVEGGQVRPTDRCGGVGLRRRRHA